MEGSNVAEVADASSVFSDPKQSQMKNGSREDTDEKSSFLVTRNKKRFLMRVKASKRELDEEDEETGARIPQTLPRRCQDCCKAGGVRRWCRTLICCRSINLLRLGDMFCLGCCCPQCYRHLDDLEIQVPVQSVEAIFDTDSSFAFPRVSEEIVEFIIQKTWDQLVVGQKTQILVQTLRASDSERHQEVSIAFSNSFHHELKMDQYELIRTTADGTASCIMSTMIMLCILIILIPIHAATITHVDSALPAWLQLFDGLIIIVFWVVVWHPIELLIYGRHMIRMRRSLCRTLAASKVSLVVLDPEKPEDNDYEFDELSPV